MSVLNRFNTTGSDHRLLRAKISVNTRLERKKMMERRLQPTRDELREKEDEYVRQLEKKLKPTDILKNMELNDLSEKITNSIRTAVRKVCVLRRKQTTKFSSDTIRLIEERRATNRDSGYRDLNRRVKKEIRKDHENSQHIGD